ncbi:MAG: hypothetical protein HXY43_12690 [Fischerella sp.]|uniref:hypothetical protein n=1 Tax=Fischerella sp. TaxID=1191 RepID=UPI0017993748|nr:hypothetical protein [Fischerella sp.]NWF60096.1 hypothetical protein [Fischerella sp.]
MAVALITDYISNLSFLTQHLQLSLEGDPIAITVPVGIEGRWGIGHWALGIVNNH